MSEPSAGPLGPAPIDGEESSPPLRPAAPATDFPPRRAIAGALGWLVGIALQMQQAALAPAALRAAVVIAGAAALVAAWRVGVRSTVVSVLAAAVGAAAIGWGVTEVRAQWRLADRLAPTLEGVDLLVDGVVEAMPQIGADGVRLVFGVEAAWRGDQRVTLPSRLALSWFRGLDDDALLAGPQVDLRAGQRWRLPLRLKRPHGPANPHGFDTELWLFERGLGAGGSVRAVAGGPVPQLLADDDGGHGIERLRQRIRDAVLLRVVDPRAAGVLAALAVGDQQAIERHDWEVFRATGVAHLMSISGLHVTMFAWLAGLVASWLWRRSARACLWWPAPLAGRAGGVVVAALYALVAGWGVPAQRTLLMLGCTVGLRALGLTWPWPLGLLLAAVAVTLLDPWALLQPGFWLSFVAVALLLASERAGGSGVPQGLRARLLAHLRSQAIASVGLAPLAAVFFQQVSVVGFVANLVAIPWVTLVVTPLALLGALAPPLWDLGALAVGALAAMLQTMGSWPGAVWQAAAAPAWAVTAGLAAAALALLPLPWRVRLLALPLAWPLLWPPVALPAPGAFELTAIDIGQGTAVLVRTRSHRLVYDAGPAYARDGDAGQRIVLPLLRALGVARIDVLMLSHRDSDHTGGAASLQAALPIERWSSSLAESHPLRRFATAHERCDAGQRWHWDGVAFEVLHPPPEDHARAGAKPNTLSCVLRIEAADGASALLTGDIEAAQEAALVERFGPRLASQLLLVPHHGSRTSSTDAFLAAVQPRVAVVQAAYRSRFGHPHPEVEARYRARGIELVRSDRCGAWIWRAGFPECTRDVQRRYWHWTEAPAGAELAPDGGHGQTRR